MTLQVRKVLIGFVFFLNIGAKAHGANKDTRDRLIDATEISALNDVAVKPWHMVLDVTLFEEAGKNPVKGTIEIWRANSNSLIKFAFGSSSATRLLQGSAVYSEASGPPISDLADAVLTEVLHPGPDPKEIANSEPELRPTQMGSVALDCIMLSPPMKHISIVPIGLFPTYCLKSGSNRIVASYNYGSYTALRSSFGKFLDHEATMEMAIREREKIVAEAKVTKLSTFVPETEQFTRGSGMLPYLPRQNVAGNVIAGKRIKKEDPVCPESAKAKRISGLVVLDAIIGRDGHIIELRPLSAPDADLAISALAAVRQWVYSPYLLNGVPVEVNTKITVNFTLGY